MTNNKNEKIISDLDEKDLEIVTLKSSIDQLNMMIKAKEAQTKEMLEDLEKIMWVDTGKDLYFEPTANKYIAWKQKWIN